MSRKMYQHIFALPGFQEKCEQYFTDYDPATDGLCFDDDYATILSDLKTKTNVKVVTDIGCAEGFQSEFFLNCYNYIGINSGYTWGQEKTYGDLVKKAITHIATDQELKTIKEIEKDKKAYVKVPFFNEGTENVQYHIAHFPEDFTESMVSDCFIANMSIGYGELQNTNMDDVRKGFDQFSRGYAKLPSEIHKILDDVFPYKKVIAGPERSKITFYTKFSNEI